MTSRCNLAMVLLFAICKLCSPHPVITGTDHSRTRPSAPCTSGPLGMESGAIPDSSITASSAHSSYPAHVARLNVGTYGWWPSTPAGQWIQVDLGKFMAITGITMQGQNPATRYYVSAFSVHHSLTGESDDWQSIRTDDGDAIRFSVSNGQPTNVTFPVVPTTRYIRILPQAWSPSSGYHTRFEVLGCQVPDAVVELVDGTDALSGRVEIFHRDSVTWGTVCANDWDINDAQVVCHQQASFLEAVEATTSSGGTDLPIVMNQVACEGTESRLADCPFICTSYQQCNSSSRAGVVCRPKLNTVRLAGGSNISSGRVEIYRNNTWGTICDNKWDINDAGVVCRQLGFSGVQEAKSGAHFGQGSGPVHMEGLACTGSENRLGGCPSFCWEESTCSHTQDAGVICRNGDTGSGETSAQ